MDQRFDRIDAAIERLSQRTVAGIEQLGQTAAERFERMDVRFEGMAERFDRMDERFDGIDKRLERMDARFDRMDERFDLMAERFDGIDKRLERMDARFDRMDERFDRMDARFDRMDERFERVNASIEGLSEHTTIRFEALTNYIGEFRVEAITRLDMMDSRIGLIVTTLASIDPNSRLPTLTRG